MREGWGWKPVVRPSMPKAEASIPKTKARKRRQCRSTCLVQLQRPSLSSGVGMISSFQNGRTWGLLGEVEPKATRVPALAGWLHVYAHVAHNITAFPDPNALPQTSACSRTALTPTWVSIDDRFGLNELGRGEADL